MSRVCRLTGRTPQSGNNVSHSQKKTKRKFLPNVHKKRVYVPEWDRYVKIRVSTRALRTIDKKGLVTFMQEQGLTLKDIQ